MRPREVVILPLEGPRGDGSAAVSAAPPEPERFLEKAVVLAGKIRRPFD